MPHDKITSTKVVPWPCENSNMFLSVLLFIISPSGFYKHKLVAWMMLQLLPVVSLSRLFGSIVGRIYLN